MKYILKKDLPWHKAGEIIDDTDNGNFVIYPIIIRYNDDKEWFEVVEENQPTKQEIKFLNKYVERTEELLLIIWEKKYIEVYKDWTFLFEHIRNKYIYETKKLSFTICNLSDLKEGDVFYVRYYNFELWNINIFVWKDDQNDYVINYLQTNHQWLEYIDVDFEYKDTEVIKINRE